MCFIILGCTTTAIFSWATPKNCLIIVDFFTICSCITHALTAVSPAHADIACILSCIQI